MKEIKELAKKIEKLVESEGWTMEAHTKILALIAMIRAQKTQSNASKSSK